MKIFKTVVSFIGEINRYKVDTIEYEGKMWLVPVWLDSETKGISMPARIICLDNLPHQKIQEGTDYHFVLNCPIPRSIVGGKNQNHKEIFIVIERPNISLPCIVTVH
jgi:hypothetical protein